MGVRGTRRNDLELARDIVSEKEFIRATYSSLYAVKEFPSVAVLVMYALGFLNRSRRTLHTVFALASRMVAFRRTGHTHASLCGRGVYP